MKAAPCAKPISIYQVDAFTDKPFKGNPAAVCVLENELSDSLMQLIASEMNLSETAFVKPLENRPLREVKTFTLRWFTPQVEVSLCGHATLATAAVLLEEIRIWNKRIIFRTRSGNLRAKKDANRICLDFPRDEPEKIDPPKPLIKALGIKDFENVVYGRRTRMLLIQLQCEEDVRDVNPDYEAMKHVNTKELIKGVTITAVGTPPYDFVSRYFGPWVGINEDPVTGSAHTLLAPYWANRLKKRELAAYQVSTRGGELIVRLKPNARVD
jgi:PhzF family phenazine biosynthesis protein